ncbi:hypothetical protein [Pinibacter aurantiacus]|nr:hypothetical protein [Pinibacter aurantiacus]
MNTHGVKRMVLSVKVTDMFSESVASVGLFAVRDVPKGIPNNR